MSSVIHVVFPDRRLMATACGRFAEALNNPDFKDKVFDWNDLRAWEMARYGTFRYLDYWEGFTLEHRELQPFREGRLAPLTPEEQRLLDLLKDTPREAVMIAAVKGDEATFTHELVHALYAQDSAYRAEVDAALRGRPFRRMRAALARMGYGEDSFVDEANAYLTTGVEKDERMLGLAERFARPRLRALLVRHFSWDPQTPPTSALRSRLTTLAYPA